MRRWSVIPVALTCLAAVPFDPHPLNESQATRLETTQDGANTIDEAGLYALMENAADWSDSEAGAVVPGYDAIRREPQAWRGARVLVEGTLERVITPELSRTGWENVSGVVIRVDHSRSVPEPHDFVIVYLTHPPAWVWRDRATAVPDRAGERVKLVARFYALSRFSTEGRAGTWKSYAVFVGRGVGFVGAPATPAQGLGSAGVLMALAFVAAIFLFWRVRAMSRGLSAQPHTQEFIEQRRRSRGVVEEALPSGQDDVELPPDPAAALENLSDKTEPPRG